MTHDSGFGGGSCCSRLFHVSFSNVSIFYPKRAYEREGLGVIGF